MNIRPTGSSSDWPKSRIEIVFFLPKIGMQKCLFLKLYLLYKVKKINFLEQNLKLLLMIKVTVSFFLNFEEISKIEPKKTLKVPKIDDFGFSGLIFRFLQKLRGTFSENKHFWTDCPLKVEFHENVPFRSKKVEFSL